MDPLKIYDYLLASRQRVLDAVGALTTQQYHHEFNFGLRTIGSTLAHIMISEWYYLQRLEGYAVPPYQQWPIKYENPPALDVIERIWREQARNVRAAIDAQSQRGAWNRKITWLSFPDDTAGGKRYNITATAGDLVTQLALHEVHHRAQVMAMLRQLGRPLEDLDYNALMFHRQQPAQFAVDR
jgi:uncharacterized damage-inducible protein DinB